MMLVLGVETTGNNMSVALGADNSIISELSGDSSRKHLETLIPCVNRLLSGNGVILSDIDLYAVSIGPGSYTGIRIGAAAVSALSQISGKPVCPVSTLEAVSYNIPRKGMVCSMIDSGRNEVYATLYKDGIQIMNQKALNINELLEILPSDSEIVFVGDGVNEYGEIILQAGEMFKLMPEEYNGCHASAVCRAGFDMFAAGKYVSCYDIVPEYMRLSQAERLKNERKA